MEVTSLRQYPAGNHDRPLSRLQERGELSFDQYHYTATSNVPGVPRNAAFIFNSLLSNENDNIVLGAEPYDPRVLLFKRLAERHHVVLHSSWPFWGNEFVPQPSKIESQIHWWEEFLDGLTTVCPTQSATNALKKQGANARHIPHAVDTTIFNPNANEESKCATPRPDEDTDHVVLFAGRLEKRKGVPELLSLAEEWIDRSVEFRFAGEGPLESRIQKSRVANGLGYLSSPELAAEYANADVLAAPSYRVEGWEELFGMVITEAFACGTPVVSTDCVGPQELITDGETGFVVEQHDTSSLRGRIEAVLSDPELRSKMGHTARKEAETTYDIDIVADQWRSVLQNLS